MDRVVTRIAAAFLGVCGAVAACGGPAKEGVQGATCFRASECSAGLVCIADATGAKVCTSDLTKVDLHEEGGAAGGAMMMPAGDASTPGAGGASGSAGAGNAGGASGAGGGKGGSGGGAGKGGSGGGAGKGGSAGAGGSGMAGTAGAVNDNDASAD